LVIENKAMKELIDVAVEANIIQMES